MDFLQCYDYTWVTIILIVEDIILKPCVEVDKLAEDLLANCVDAESYAGSGRLEIRPWVKRVEAYVLCYDLVNDSHDNDV